MEGFVDIFYYFKIVLIILFAHHKVFKLYDERKNNPFLFFLFSLLFSIFFPFLDVGVVLKTPTSFYSNNYCIAAP